MTKIATAVVLALALAVPARATELDFYGASSGTTKVCLASRSATTCGRSFFPFPLAGKLKHTRAVCSLTMTATATIKFVDDGSESSLPSCVFSSGRTCADDTEIAFDANSKLAFSYVNAGSETNQWCRVTGDFYLADGVTPYPAMIAWNGTLDDAPTDLGFCGPGDVNSALGDAPPRCDSTNEDEAAFLVPCCGVVGMAVGIANAATQSITFQLRDRTDSIVPDVAVTISSGETIDSDMTCTTNCGTGGGYRFSVRADCASSCDNGSNNRAFGFMVLFDAGSTNVSLKTMQHVRHRSGGPRYGTNQTNTEPTISDNVSHCFTRPMRLEELYGWFESPPTSTLDVMFCAGPTYNPNCITPIATCQITSGGSGAKSCSWLTGGVDFMPGDCWSLAHGAIGDTDNPDSLHALAVLREIPMPTPTDTPPASPTPTSSATATVTATATPSPSITPTLSSLQGTPGHVFLHKRERRFDHARPRHFIHRRDRHFLEKD